jgi:Transposase DDE domain
MGGRPELALDATGLDSRHASRHYARRNTSKRFPMRRFTLLAVACHTQSHLIAAAEVAAGPTNESPFFDDLVGEAGQHAPWDRLLADAAYDSEANHETARFFGIRSAVIPLNRRGAGRKWPRTRYRRQMVRRFRKRPRGRRRRRVYGQRWQAESVFSRNKRLLGAALRARSEHSRSRECLLRVLTHNLMLLAATEY